MDIQIDTHLPQQELLKLLRSLPSNLSGRASNIEGVRRVFLAHFTHTLFSLLIRSYIARANGGSDRLGNRWAPLADSTLARKHRTMRLGVITEFNMMSDRRIAKWNKDQQDALASLKKAGVSSKEATKLATRIAWQNSRSQIPIGVESGQLIRACRPGTISGNRYYAPKGQFLSEDSGVVEIGLDVDHSVHFDRKRKIWPKNIRPWIIEACRVATTKTLEYMKTLV